MAAKATDSNTASATSLELQLFSEADVATSRVVAAKPARARQTRQPSKAQPTLLNQESLLLEEPELFLSHEDAEPELSLSLENIAPANTESVPEQVHLDGDLRTVEMTAVLAEEKTSGVAASMDEDDEELSAGLDPALTDERVQEETSLMDHAEASMMQDELHSSVEATSKDEAMDESPGQSEGVTNDSALYEEENFFPVPAASEVALEEETPASPVEEMQSAGLMSDASLPAEPEPLTQEEADEQKLPTFEEMVAPSAISEEASRYAAHEEAAAEPESVPVEHTESRSSNHSYIEHVQSSVSLVFPPGIEFFPGADATIHSKPHPAPEEPARTTLSQVIGSLPAAPAIDAGGQAPEVEFQADEEEGAVAQPLPKELRHVATALEKAMHDPMLLPGAFSNFCGAAYVKPEWAGAASDYLAMLFDEQQDVLAEMTRVPDLIIELGSGHYTLTFMVASRWAAKADLARLTRLAEALVATQAKLNSPEVVDLMLALTTSLAISRYSRAEQLLAAAEAHATESEQDALKEAHLWLGAGKVVRVCTQEVRDLWDQRLRRPRVAWTWTSREECDALAQIAETLDPNSQAARLFYAVVPACWWSMLVVRAQERAQYENALSVAKTAGQGRGGFLSEEGPTVTTREVVRQPIIIWRAIPFFMGGLVGAWALLLGIWLGPFDLVRPSEEAVAQVAPSTEAPASENAPVPAASGVEHPNALWRKDRIASLEVEAPELRRLVEQIGIGHWAAYETLLRGDSADLPKTEDKYQKLLLWLHLDPPADAEIRKQVPLMLVALRQDSTVIDLWQKLVYPGSLNAEEIQSAALRTLHDNVESWSASQRKALGDLAKAPLNVP